ncbi:hypothetical protein TPHA_0D01100 [Tetrapisispora phaffii CBS 4417]|uniref:DNA replication factor Cdt1 C-terminal domain-containing protein n=1 Tax=Tetrapisispora phaffii (strain ATCC 24235 / CBS 4417 / NBRC 1672 / NRRL Y-8282 / UCD 70-5) TaxID=1071381 RepID=G8BSD0_TETPH|nr:hypothetical protein TPHA_0D01100 [Tetrapisispora phaffii CBS 4417]CCE62751.1 hypothetical protein TPHA_0D01100 [Tetrapisispora phaffii CBS 4417]
MNSKERRLPIIDLNKISDEQELLPIIRSILLRNDTFLIKNFANRNIIDGLLDDLSQTLPDLNQGFDSNFTGTIKLPDYSDDIHVEQYIFNTDTTIQFNRECENIALRKLYNRLFRLSLFLSSVCLKSIGPEFEKLISEEAYSTKLTRYYLDSEYNRKVNENEDNRLDINDILPYDILVESMFSQTYELFNSSGIISIFPVASEIMYKPQTVSVSDNTNWANVSDTDSILVHSGELLSILSGNLYTTSPLKINYGFNKLVHLTFYPPLSTPINYNGKETTVNDILFENQIKEFPIVADKFYKSKVMLNALVEKLNFYKRLFTTAEAVLSLYLLSKSTGASPELHSILPQMTNMMAAKITEESFLRMLSIWPEAYTLSNNSNQELTVDIPKLNPLATLTSKSRKLDFVHHAEKWLQKHKTSEPIPSDVPILKYNKRRLSDSNTKKQKTPDLRNGKTVENLKTSNLSSNDNNKRQYLHNTREELEFKEREVSSQSDLLKKIRAKSKRSEALLEQRQRQYEQFLAVKMRHILKIISSLPWDKPYTITSLTSLIVDSLQDSNNPIGLTETEDILLRFQKLIPDMMGIYSVAGGLKVFKWSYLDKELVEKRLEDFKKIKTILVWNK